MVSQNVCPFTSLFAICAKNRYCKTNFVYPSLVILKQQQQQQHLKPFMRSVSKNSYLRVLADGLRNWCFQNPTRTLKARERVEYGIQQEFKAIVV